MNIFNRVYPFTTEKIDAYFNTLDLKDKTILTVGSSGDQVFNALTLDAGKVVLYDINPNTEKFYKLKRDLILNNNREELYHKVNKLDNFDFFPELFSLKDLEYMNTYMSSDKAYNKLRERLKDDNTEFITGDIFNLKETINNKTFDRIILSNILQYINIFSEDKGYTDNNKFLRDNFIKWIDCLNDEGIIQLFYYYCYNTNIINLYEAVNTLYDYPLHLIKLEENNPLTDAIVTYKKR